MAQSHRGDPRAEIFLRTSGDVQPLTIPTGNVSFCVDQFDTDLDTAVGQSFILKREFCPDRCHLHVSRQCGQLYPVICDMHRVCRIQVDKFPYPRTSENPDPRCT